MLTQSSWGRKGLALPFLGDPAKMTRDTDWRSMLRRYNGEGAQPKMAVPLLSLESEFWN